MDTRAAIEQLQNSMNQSIIGQQHIVERLVIGLLCNGNLLVEGLPGLAKTRAIKSMAAAIESDFSRIQFTPDMLPTDVTGSENMYEENGEYKFRFEPGPVFGNIVLADEVNRAPAKVQSAMLEAMEERQVTVSGTTHHLPDLFMVMATQNPVEQEGTYPLPEAQMDRFLMHVYIDYPDESSEQEIMRLVRAERSSKESEKPEKIPQSTIFAAREAINAVQMSEAIERYIVDLIFATRYPERYDPTLAGWIDLGSSPRATLGLDQCARSYAWLQGRDYVSPEDIRAVVHDVLRHRIAGSYEAQADGINNNAIIDKILQLVALPG